MVNVANLKRLIEKCDRRNATEDYTPRYNKNMKLKDIVYFNEKGFVAISLASSHSYVHT